jgi:hypothetical protein
MQAQLIALWIIVALEAVFVGLLLARSGGLMDLLRRRRDKPRGNPDELVGQRLPPLRVTLVGPEEDGPAPRKTVFTEGSLVVFVTARCVASHRLLGVLLSKLEKSPAGFPVIFALLGSPSSARRLQARFPVRKQAVAVTDQRFATRFADAVPFAVTLGQDTRVTHAGTVDSGSAFVKFVEACGSEDVRRWFAPPSGPAGTPVPLVSAHGDAGGEAAGTGGR